MSHILLDGVSCAAPDGSILFPPFSDAISREAVGLFGHNGSGKTTLLTAIAGMQTPYAGSISVDGQVGYMRQSRFAEGVTVASSLGIQPQIDALARIEGGSPQPEDFENPDWTLPARIEDALSTCGLSGLAMDHPVRSMSGGEKGRLKLAATLLSGPDILLLDEPTNDLDAAGREMVAGLIEQWTGPLLIASHDRWLLERMDRIIELYSAGVMSVSGGWSAFARERDKARQHAKKALSEAEAQAKSARKSAQAKIERQDRRNRQGRVASARRDDSKLFVNIQKQRAEASSARNRALGKDQIEQAQSALKEAQSNLARIVPVHIELPETAIQPGHTLIEAKAITCSHAGRRLFGPLDLTITGPERVFVGGPNGSGKTSLIRILCGQERPSSGAVRGAFDNFAVLDQHLSLLNRSEIVLHAMQRHNPDMDLHAAHAALAKFGFRGNWAQHGVSSLSGGEMIRLALACLFSRTEPPKLLILDEPTNHLDTPSIEMLETALQSYGGALICITHDEAFRINLQLTRSIVLGSA